MAAYICKQPNGLYCRFSSVVDCPTHWNMTKEDIINLFVERAKQDALERIEDADDYELIKEQFVPNNMTEEEFDRICKEMETTIYKADV